MKLPCRLLLAVALAGSLAGPGFAQEAATTQISHVAAPSELPTAGSYQTNGGFVYVGMSGSPAKSEIEFYDSHSRRWGNLTHMAGTNYRSDNSPYLHFDLNHPSVAVMEDKHVLTDASGRLGYSLWHAPGAKHRPLIVLVHGADDATRAFGFLTSYFVAHGLDVLTYDQRGTGESVGNWRYTSPASKADDIIAALHEVSTDSAVNPEKIGAWGPSNGGWVAPIVTQHHHLTFMILKSAPSESIANNVLYEIRQVLQEHGKFSKQQIDAAMGFESHLFHDLDANNDWANAQVELAAAKQQPWFPLMRIPPELTLPPPPPMLAALRASLIYDPSPVLEKTTVPTLALFGARDRNVDATDAAAGFRKYFKQAGMHDFTVHVFPNADHLLADSQTGYIDDEPDAATLVRGYPDIMIRWLAARGLTR